MAPTISWRVCAYDWLLVNCASLGARKCFVIWCIAISGGEESAADRILWLSWLNLDQTELIFKVQRETRTAREHIRRYLGGSLVVCTT